MKKITFFIILFYILIPSQKESLKKIDHALFNEIPSLEKEGLYSKALSVGFQIKEESSKKNYFYGEAWADYSIANSLCNLEEFEKSRMFLNEARTKNNAIKDKALDVAIIVGNGRIYNEKKLSYSLAVKQFKRALNKVEKLPYEQDKNKWKIVIFKNLISSYYNLSRSDSAYYYSQRANAIANDLYVITSLTHYHLNTSNDTDSALYYLKKSKTLLQTNSQKFEEAISENQWSRYYLKINNPKKSLIHSKNASKLATEIFSANELLASYQNIGMAYKALGKLDEAEKYFNKESALSANLNNNLLKNLDEDIIKIVENESNNEHRKRLMTINIIIFISIIVVLFLLWRIKRVKAIKNSIIKSAERQISQKSKTLLKKDAILRKLSRETFDDVVELAKMNSPNFYLRFTEIYPDFNSKIIGLSDEITRADLLLSAYIYLGFNTKEIANFTFRSVKTIQNRKNSIRKKLKIGPHEDLYQWFLKIVDNDIH